MLGFYIIHCKSSWTLKHRYNEDLVTDYSVNCSRLQFFTWLLIFRFNLRRQNTFSSKQTTTKWKIGEVCKKNRHQSTKLMKSKIIVLISLWWTWLLLNWRNNHLCQIVFYEISGLFKSISICSSACSQRASLSSSVSVSCHRILFLQYWAHRVE